MYDAAVIVRVAAGGQHVVVTAILIDDLVLLAECSREHEWEGLRHLGTSVKWYHHAAGDAHGR